MKDKGEKIEDEMVRRWEDALSLLFGYSFFK